MKKILLLASGALLFASCATKKVVEETPPPPPQSVGRQPVESVEGTLLLHPVMNKYQGTTKNYYSFYDYPNRYLYITDQDTIAESIRSFLPEEVTKENIGYAAVLQSATINPFASLTKEVRDKIKETKGIEFDNINSYQIAKSFNIKEYTSSPEALQTLRSMLGNAKSGTEQGKSSGRKPISGAQGLLTYHPIKNLIKGSNGRDYFFFLDRTNHYIYITDDAALYEKISDALPIVAGTENAVILQGVAIDPIILFKPETTKAMEEDQGFELNGGSGNGDNINNYTLATIDNYAIVKDYKAVIAAIDAKLGASAPLQQHQTTKSTASSVSTQKKTAAPAPVPPPPVTGGNGRRPGH